MICAWYGSMARMIWLVDHRRLDAVFFLDLEVAQDRRARVAHVALIVGVDLQQAVGALDDLHRGHDARRLQRDVGDPVDRDAGRDLDEQRRLPRHGQEPARRLAHEARQLRLQSIQEGVAAKRRRGGHRRQSYSLDAARDKRLRCVASWRATMPISWPVSRVAAVGEEARAIVAGCSPCRRRSRRARRRRAPAAGGSPPSDRRATCRPRRAATGSRRRPPAAPPSAASNAATTSAPTSKQHGPMAGPSATRRSSGRAPNSATSARTAAGSTPATVPRQPACAAATAPVRGSTISAGMQSATNTPSATPGVVGDQRVRLDRARSPPDRRPARTRTTAAPWTCRAT